MKKVVCIIQARMGSTRLPGKTMTDLFGKPMLEHVIDRVKQSSLIDEIVIATTELERDNLIADQAQRSGVRFFRGSEDDVLSRYYFAAKENKADVVVRITSDCPLIDPNIVDEIISFFIKSDYDIISNASPEPGQRTYPRGLDTEVFSFDNLEDAYINAAEKYQREHVTPYLYENENNKVFYYKNSKDFSGYRWTLDTQEDLDFVKSVYKKLYHGEHDFFMQDVINLLEKFPELTKINENIRQKQLKPLNTF